MTQTTSSSVTELINAEAIDQLIIAYQSDDQVITPFFRFKSLIGTASPVASFPRWVKDAHEDLATEGTAMTAVELETTDVQITAARVGLAREPTNTSFEDTILGRAGFMASIAQDAAILLGMAADEDAAAQFANATGSVTDSGNPIEILDMVEMMGTQRTNKAKGAQVFNLHDYHLKQLQRAQASATATPWATFYQPAADSTAFGGYFMGAPIFASSLNPTANAGADRVSAVYSRGDIEAQKMYCAFGYVVARTPTTKEQEQILADSLVVATTTRYGVGTIAANFATKGTFDNG